SSSPASSKGPSAEARRPAAARSTYRGYASRAALGRRLALGLLSSRQASAPSLGVLVPEPSDEDIEPLLDSGGGAGQLPDPREASEGADQPRHLHRHLLEPLHHHADPIQFLVRAVREGAKLSGQRLDLARHGTDLPLE